MDDHNEQTTKPTKRASTPKSAGKSEPPKTAATTRTSTRPKRMPKAEAPATSGSKRVPTADAPATAAQRTGADATEDGAPSRDEMSIAFTPAQMAVGGAIVAGLLVFGVRLLLGRRRGRS